MPCTAPRPGRPVTGVTRGVETPVVPSPPPSPGRGHCGRCYVRSLSKQARLSQCSITKSESHVCLLSEYRTCFRLILKPLFTRWRWVPAAVCRVPPCRGRRSLWRRARPSPAVTKPLLKHAGNREGSSGPGPAGLRQDQSLSLCRPRATPPPRAPGLGTQWLGCWVFPSVEAHGACSWRPLACACCLPLTLAQSLPKVLSVETSGGLPQGGRLWPVQEELQREDALGQIQGVCHQAGHQLSPECICSVSP